MMACVCSPPEIAAISPGVASKRTKLNTRSRGGSRKMNLDHHSEVKVRVFSCLNEREIRIRNRSLFSLLNSSPKAVQGDQRAKDELEELDLGREDWISRQFSAPVQSSSSPKRKEEGSDKQDYYVNSGYAIRALREDLPEIFYREPTFDIYREDIVFKDPINTFGGIDNYKMIFWALRFNSRIFFKSLWIDIGTVWQPAESVIMIRWTVHGIPRVPWESHGRFDGTSKYKLDKNGKIFEHRVDNIALNSPPKFRVLAVDELIQSLSCPSTPKPTYFEILPFLMGFTWVRYYLAFNLILAWKRCAGT